MNNGKSKPVKKVIKIKKPNKKELGEKVLRNGFKVKDYDKFKLYKFYRDIYLMYYGKDANFKSYEKNPNAPRGIQISSSVIKDKKKSGR